jgi:Ca2+-dependent lipid-binding protein
MLPGNDMFERVELYFNGRNLKDLDFFSKSDPSLLFFQENPASVLKAVGKTEVVKDNVNPDWKKSFQLNYIFEARQ